ncbi:ABC transporter permease [Nocardioides sp. GY 10113]|uniref:ABC transporter permease n=1 Tax=Nocardioides sp. GY 10113 TaxID=2569761 RepID=UPI0010A8F5AC|nr:ABC transporter permease [Nocardioides sp. GY 10113]TIC79654.1 ABC transporter permease [Nocardioides sp. GY 10113]TIC85779.1 ABC transporter permease [Nocardioides sp. GY 10113]
MRFALVAEYRKLVSTRLWWLLLIVLAAYLAFIGGVMAASIVLAPADQALPVAGEQAAAGVYGLVNAIGYVFPLVIGSLLVTSEFRHRTITESLLVEPRRGVLLAGKLLLAVPLGLLYGVVGTAALAGTAGPLLAWRGDGAYLTDPDVLAVLGLGVVVTALWAVIGVAFGAVVPNQVAAIVGLLAFTQFVEPVARLALGAFEATASVGRFLPGAAADGLIGVSLLGEMGGGSADLLPRWAALLVLVGYAAVLALVGRLTTLRRDIG